MAWATSLCDRDRSGRTLAHGLVHFCAQVVGGRLVQDAKRAIITDLEDFGRRFDAQAVEVAGTQVDDYLLTLKGNQRKVRC